jgi:hypothetical protein
MLAFDMLFAAWLLILIGGLSTTFCLYSLATRSFSLSDKKRLGIVAFEIKEEERFRKREDERLKKMIIDHYTEMLKNQDNISKLQKNNDEKD